MRGRKKLKVVELFSGIGSQAKALKNIGANFEIAYTCEWNIHALTAYGMIHEKNGDKIYDSLNEKNKLDLIRELEQLGVSNDGKSPMNEMGLRALSEDALRRILAIIKETSNLIDISKIDSEILPADIDIMTYSFPCQDLSNVGAFHGYNKGIDRNAGNRSGLLWEAERILLDRCKKGLFLPKILLMENVPALDSARHKKNFNEWKSQLKKLGYYNKQYILNACDFGLPQNRERLLMISILTENDPDIEKELDMYFDEHNLESSDYRESLNLEKKTLSHLLKLDYNNPTYYKEAVECQPNRTVSRQKIWDENLQITDKNGKIIVDNVATLTTKQDRHPNSGNIWVDFDNGKSNFRYLTPRECFLLMGFDEEDYENVLAGNFCIKQNSEMFTRDSLIKMAGNSIAVNVLEAVFQQIIEIYESYFDDLVMV